MSREEREHRVTEPGESRDRKLAIQVGSLYSEGEVRYKQVNVLAGRLSRIRSSGNEVVRIKSTIQPKSWHHLGLKGRL